MMHFGVWGISQIIFISSKASALPQFGGGIGGAAGIAGSVAPAAAGIAGSLAGSPGVSSSSPPSDSIGSSSSSSPSGASRGVTGPTVVYSTVANPPPGVLAQSRGPLGPYVNGVPGPAYGANWANTGLILSILQLTDDQGQPSSKYSSDALDATCYNASTNARARLNHTDFNLLLNHMAKIMNIQNSGTWDPQASHVWDSGTDEPGNPRRAVMDFFPKDAGVKAETFPPGAMMRIASTLVNSTCTAGYGGQAFSKQHPGWGVAVSNRAG